MTVFFTPVRTSDALSQPRPGGDLSPGVREGLDRAAAPQAGPNGVRKGSDPLPSGEQNSFVFHYVDKLLSEPLRVFVITHGHHVGVLGEIIRKLLHDFAYFSPLKFLQTGQLLQETCFLPNDALMNSYNPYVMSGKQLRALFYQCQIWPIGTINFLRHGRRSGNFFDLSVHYSVEDGNAVFDCLQSIFFFFSSMLPLSQLFASGQIQRNAYSPKRADGCHGVEKSLTGRAKPQESIKGANEKKYQERVQRHHGSDCFRVLPCFRHMQLHNTVGGAS